MMLMCQLFSIFLVQIKEAFEMLEMAYESESDDPYIMILLVGLTI